MTLRIHEISLFAFYVSLRAQTFCGDESAAMKTKFWHSKSPTWTFHQRPIVCLASGCSVDNFRFLPLCSTGKCNSPANGLQAAIVFHRLLIITADIKSGCSESVAKRNWKKRFVVIKLHLTARLLPISSFIMHLNVLLLTGIHLWKCIILSQIKENQLWCQIKCF